MKLLKTILLLLLPSIASASTITGNFQYLLGNGLSTNTVTISSPDFPRSYNGIFYFQPQQITYLTNGLLNLTLPVSGHYNLSFQNAGTVQIIIPQDNNTYDIGAVAQNLTTFSYTNAIPLIDGLVKAGTNVSITINNAGVPTEFITVAVPGFAVLNVTNYVNLLTNASFPTPIVGQVTLVTSNYDLWMVTPLATNRVALGH